MKTLKLNTILKSIALILAFTALSCYDDDTTIIIDRDLASKDAEELIAISLSYDTYGLVAHFDHIGQEIENISECDVTNTDTQIETGNINSNYDYIYTFTEVFTLYCEPELYLEYALEGDLEFDAYNFEEIQQININFTTTGLEDISDEEIYNGNYNTTGEMQSDFNNNTYEYSYDSTIFDIRVNKESNKIVSGSVTFSLVQTYSRNNLTYTYNGTIEFLNENAAEVTFDNGEVFVVDINNVSISN